MTLTAVEMNLIPSEKQFLQALLTKQSQRKMPENHIETTSEHIQSGFLLHGSPSQAIWIVSRS